MKCFNGNGDIELLAAISVNHAIHQKEHATAIKDGLARHGIESIFTQGDNIVAHADFHVIWSIKRPAILEFSKKEGKPVLVMERGHLQDRMKYTSCGWDGLANHGRYPIIDDGGKRWKKHWGNSMHPWRACGQYALIVGQVLGDAAVRHIDFPKWEQRMCNELLERGYKRVVYRPHPQSRPLGYQVQPPRGSELSQKSLDGDLYGASLAVTFNSTAGVESVLYGVPTITMDKGSMAWPVTTHSLDEEPIRPDRSEWAHRLAWTSWTLEEIASGEAWGALRTVLEDT